MKRIAVVTGANSGIGKEFVRLLSKMKEIDEVWAIARNKEKLASLVTAYGKKVIPFSIDLSDVKNIYEFEKTLIDSKVKITYLINSAGVAKICKYSEMDIDSSLNMINLNVSAVVAMGLVCIPHMTAGSHILNLASQASFQPLPYFNIYASTKAFVRSYSRALNVELKEKKITVTAVCPGWVDTPLIDKGITEGEKGIKKFVGLVSPDAVAKKALSDAQKGKDMSVCSLFIKSCHFASKVLPQKVLMKAWLAQLK